MSSATSDIQVRSIKVDGHSKMASDKKAYYRDDDVYTSSKNDGYYDIDADVGIRLNQNTEMASGKQLNASADGVVTLVKAGEVTDGDFTTDTDGLIAIDSSNGRIYIRYGGAWHYAAVDAGLQLPEKTCNICKQEFLKGDNVIFRVDGFMNDKNKTPHLIPIHDKCKEIK